MTVYELIQKLVEYPSETKIMFKCNDENAYNCDFKYKKYKNELHIELY